MGCAECGDLGPPPNNILFIPPPPLPEFMHSTGVEYATNTTCIISQFCESWTVTNRLPEEGDYVELPRKDIETNWSVTSIDDTWLLVLVISSVGVLLLGALLAMILLKCRDMNMFGSNEYRNHQHRQIKNTEPRDCASINNINCNKLVHPADSMLYYGSTNIHSDNRMVWAALTPHGTQHFISESYPKDIADYIETDNQYETIDNIQSQNPTYYSTYSKEYEYEDPTLLIENYQSNNWENRIHQHRNTENTDMRCANIATLRRGAPLTYRPRVSSPTRIENPNLPPLNLYPQQSNTLKRNGTLNYKSGTLPRYEY